MNEAQIDDAAGWCRIAFGRDAAAFNDGIDTLAAELKKRALSASEGAAPVAADLVEALRSVLSLIRRNAPELSGKVIGAAEAAIERATTPQPAAPVAVDRGHAAWVDVRWPLARLRGALESEYPRQEVDLGDVRSLIRALDSLATPQPAVNGAGLSDARGAYGRIIGHLAVLAQLPARTFRGRGEVEFIEREHATITATAIRRAADDLMALAVASAPPAEAQPSPAAEPVKPMHNECATMPNEERCKACRTAPAAESPRGSPCELKDCDPDSPTYKQWLPARFVATDLVGGEPIVQRDGRMPVFATWASVRGVTRPAAPLSEGFGSLADTRHEVNTHANVLRSYIDSLSGEAFQGAIHSLGSLRDIIDGLIAVAAPTAPPAEAISDEQIHGMLGDLSMIASGHDADMGLPVWKPDAVKEMIAAVRTVFTRPAAPLSEDRFADLHMRLMEAHGALLAKYRALQASPAPQPPPEDTKRLDWLETQCEAYGFAGIHEGNRWVIDGPFATARKAIDAAMSATPGGGK